MKVLVTGANGYVGSELLATLLEGGHAVHSLTRSAAPPPGVLLAGHTGHDLRLPLPALGDDFDLVIHAAGANDIQSQDPRTALELSALTTRQCAEFAARQRTPRLIYLSTFQVYGSDEGQIDEATPCRPRNDYALTHLFAEQWAEQYARTKGLQFVNVRPANIAGMPRSGDMQRWSLTPGCFCRDAVANSRILVRSTGLQQRDFLPVAEVARRIAQVAEHFDAFAGGAVNICSGATLTIADVARLAAARRPGGPAELEFLPPADASREPPPALAVGSRYFDLFPGERLSLEAARAMMAASIDETYRYILNQIPQESIQ